MYTQCPECSSIFEITATDLAVAGGFVRCGQCSSSFDALNSLSDNPDAIKASAAKSKAKSALDKVKSKARPAVPNKKARMPAKLTRRRKPSRGKPVIPAGVVATDPNKVVDDTVSDAPAADVVLLPDADDLGTQDHTDADNETPSPNVGSETEPLPDDGLAALSNDTPDINEVDPSSIIVKSAEIESAEIEPAEIEPAEIESAEIEPAEIESAEIDSAEPDTGDETDDAQLDDTEETNSTVTETDADPDAIEKSDVDLLSTPSESDDNEIGDEISDDQNDSAAGSSSTATADDDEILLDDTYQSPYSADDEVYLDDDPVDSEHEEYESAGIVIPDPDDLAEAIERDDDASNEDNKPDEDLSDTGLPDTNLLDKEQDNDVDSNFETFFDDDLETDLVEEAEMDADPNIDDSNTDDSNTDEPNTDDSNADDQEVDESVLFALPLPELTALQPSVRGLLPEKLEGGEAACDPSAQTPASQFVKQPQSTVVQRSPHLPRAEDAYDAEDARDLKEYLEAPTNRWATAVWLSGSVLMALLLIGQFVHRHRSDLVTHPRLGPVVSSIYDTVGSDLRPNWQIDQYEIVGDARLFLMPNDNADEQSDEAGSTIRFVAIISNGANRPQPAPMVRLTLRDRWGDATGARDFTPPEYLADRALIGRMLEPGQRLRVILNLRDQGAEAVGFDFDMCLPDGAGTLRCNSEDAG